MWSEDMKKYQLGFWGHCSTGLYWHLNKSKLPKSMSWQSTAALLALSFSGLGSLVYLILSHNNEDEEFRILKTSRPTIIEVQILKESIAVVIGRGGNTIKEIEAKSNAKLTIKNDDSSSEFKNCIIRGSPESDQCAESLIHEIIVNQPLIETYKMSVPVQACGRIIGKNGDNIKLICRNSNTKITVQSHPSSAGSFEKKYIFLNI